MNTNAASRPLPWFSLMFDDNSNGYIGFDSATLYQWLRAFDLAPVEPVAGADGTPLFKASRRPRRLRSYSDMKAAARALAVEWQDAAASWALSWEGVWAWGYLFDALGRRYGLKREFSENGIC